MKRTWMEIWNPDEEMIERIENLTINYDSSDFDDFWTDSIVETKHDNRIFEPETSDSEMDIEYPDSDEGYFNFSMEYIEKLKSNKYISEGITGDKRDTYDKYITDKEDLEKIRVEKIRLKIEKLTIDNLEIEEKKRKLDIERKPNIRLRLDALNKQSVSSFQKRIKKFKEEKFKEEKKNQQKFNRYKDSSSDSHLKFIQYKQKPIAKRRKFFNGTKISKKSIFDKQSDIRKLTDFIKGSAPDVFASDDRINLEKCVNFNKPTKDIKMLFASSKKNKIPSDYSDLIANHCANTYNFTSNPY